MRRWLTQVFAATLISSTAVGGPGKSRPTAKQAAEFAATTQLGRLIAETDAASARATDVLLAGPRDESKIRGFFAVLDHDQWFVYFGILSDDGNTYATGYVFSAPRGHLEQLRAVDPARAPKDVTPFARAIAASRSHAVDETGNGGVNPVLVAGQKTIDVFVLQGGQDPNVVLLGGDWHDQWDLTGKKLLAREQFHKSVLTVQLHDPEHTAREAAGSYHSHVLIEGPSATDVAVVLENPAIAPMWVLGKSGTSYRIDRDGSIHVDEHQAPKPRP